MKKLMGITLSLLLALGAVLLALPAPAQAHCDNVNGPVVTAARQALEAGDATLILPYIKVTDETELRAAFDHALKVRRLGGEAQALADQFFFETAVRLHRQGEGAAYTGLKYEDDYGPALHAAEEALRINHTTEVEAVLAKTIAEGLTAKFHAVLEAREHAATEGTVEANRERVEAELLFEIYVHEIYLAATGAAPHGEGGTGGHQHGNGGATAAEPAVLKVFVNHAVLAAPALSEGGTIMLPLRAVIEAAGGTIEWDAATSTATARLGGADVKLQAGVPGKAVLHDGTMLVDAHLLEETLGLKLDLADGVVEIVH